MSHTIHLLLISSTESNTIYLPIQGYEAETTNPVNYLLHQFLHYSVFSYPAPCSCIHHLHSIMSAEAGADTHTQPMTTPSYSSESGDSNNTVIKDVVLWRRKKLNATILIAATAIWVLMEAYQFNFLTVLSWLATFVVASIFLFANMTRLLGKDLPNLSRLELTEETAVGMANTARLWIEEGIRLMFRVSAEEQWHVFVGTVVGLLLLSYVGSCMDLLTFLYIGTMVGLTVPVTYVKNEDKIKRMMDWLRGRCKRSYEIIDEKAIKKITTRVMNGNQNQNGMKKTE